MDLEDRRGKDEQRVDEGLHLHIYKVKLSTVPLYYSDKKFEGVLGLIVNAIIA